jgi:uncharacterized protein (DUF2062 family)
MAADRENGRDKEKGRGERWVRAKRSLRFFYLRLLRLKGQPEEVAGGMAIGVFIGMTPTVPLYTVLAVLIAFIMRKSKLAAALGVWIANPFFLPFIYILDYKVGQAITGIQAPSFIFKDFSFAHFLNLGWNISGPLLLGGAVTGGILAVPAYFLTKRVVILYRKKRQKRLNRIGLAPKTT